MSMQKHEGWLVCGIFLAIIAGFNIDVMDIDAAQYASMSREMMVSGSYLQVYDLGKDYLDKPPFLFWVSSLSMKIFGPNNFAYKFPSVLFALLAVYSTYRFALVYYNKRIAFLAAIVLAGSQGFFLMNHDVRTDTILMSWVIFTIWQLAAWFQNRNFRYFLFACVGIAGGMMTKGPIALITPIFAFASQLIYHRRLRDFFRWEYVAGIFIIALLITPMCIGLYRQFDLHPEKIVDGKTGVSGLRFFFWTQSFGRITGESEWSNNSNIFFLLQNMLWSFLPWIIFFLLAVGFKIKTVYAARGSANQKPEVASLAGFIFTYIALGLSKYQLPHYIFVVFPLASIITADFLHSLMTLYRQSTLYRVITTIHSCIFLLLGLALILLLSIPFSSIPWWAPVLASGAILFVTGYLIRHRAQTNALLILTLATSVIINLFVNAFFYPALMSYQMGGSAGRFIRDQNLPIEKIFLYKHENYRSLQFYAKGIIERKDSLAGLNSGTYLITTEDALQEFKERNIQYEVIRKGEDFRVSKLKLKFINPANRPKVVGTYLIVKIK